MKLIISYAPFVLNFSYVTLSRKHRHVRPFLRLLRHTSLILCIKTRSCTSVFLSEFISKYNLCDLVLPEIVVDVLNSNRSWRESNISILVTPLFVNSRKIEELQHFPFLILQMGCQVSFITLKLAGYSACNPININHSDWSFLCRIIPPIIVTKICHIHIIYWDIPHLGQLLNVRTHCTLASRQFISLN